jgi:hypothetical protein
MGQVFAGFVGQQQLDKGLGIVHVGGLSGGDHQRGYAVAVGEVDTRAALQEEPGGFQFSVCDGIGQGRDAVVVRFSLLALYARRLRSLFCFNSYCPVWEWT